MEIPKTIEISTKKPTPEEVMIHQMVHNTTCGVEPIFTSLYERILKPIVADIPFNGKHVRFENLTQEQYEVLTFLYERSVMGTTRKSTLKIKPYEFL